MFGSKALAKQRASIIGHVLAGFPSPDFHLGATVKFSQGLTPSSLASYTLTSQARHKGNKTYGTARARFPAAPVLVGHA